MTAETAAVDVVADGGGVPGRPRTVEEIRAEVLLRQLRPVGGRVSWPADLMADLWRLPEAGPYLAEGTVKAVYLFLRDVSMTQRQIGRMVGQSQSEISEIVAGRRVQMVAVLARIASGLHLPPGVFGLAPRDTDPAASAVAGDVVAAGPDGGAASRGGGVAEVVATAPIASRHTGRVHQCPTCQCATPVAPLVGPHHGKPVGPLYWTGAEIRALRLSVHMSVRQFAAAMGVSDRAVSKWERGGAGWVPRPHSQAAADRLLSQALPMQRARFSAWLTGPHPGAIGQRDTDGRASSTTHGQDGVGVNGRHGAQSAPQG